MSDDGVTIGFDGADDWEPTALLLGKVIRAMDAESWMRVPDPDGEGKRYYRKGEGPSPLDGGA